MKMLAIVFAMVCTLGEDPARPDVVFVYEHAGDRFPLCELTNHGPDVPCECPVHHPVG